VLGDLEVRCQRLDGAVDARAIDQLEPDRLTPPGKLAERECEPCRRAVAAAVGRSPDGSGGRANETAGP
jgi:hypothetical protein